MVRRRKGQSTGNGEESKGCRLPLPPCVLVYYCFIYLFLCPFYPRWVICNFDIRSIDASILETLCISCMQLFLVTCSNLYHFVTCRSLITIATRRKNGQMQTHIRTGEHAHMYICILIYIDIFTYIYICIVVMQKYKHIFMYICMYIYIYIYI